MKPGLRNIVLGIIAGGLAGYLYYHFVGCSSGSCPITSHSYSMIIVGALSGYILTSSSGKKKENK